MPLSPGHKLAHYELLEPIGRGGMGEVYRAKDSKLGRDVAIKVLPDEFSQDEARLSRFRREAKVLASLNHPSIASIYGLERTGETNYLVLELVPGETLAERIARGPMPLDEALDVARKIAEALEVAHDQGIVHRDLKPANVKLTPDDEVKVLDFGLAKALVEEGPTESASTSMSPTLTRDATQIGVILGTAAYMSPEQAKGKRVDERTDIFAFGAVLYEMLTGRKAFPGDDISDVLASVIKSEPDWRLLPAETPSSIRRLLRRSLEKDKKRRLPDVAVARLEIDDAFAAPSLELDATEPHPRVGERRWQRLAPWALAALLAGIAGVAVWTGRRLPASPSTARVVVSLPSDQELLLGEEGAVPPLALSPDGRLLVYTAARRGDGRAQLFLRQMDRFDPAPIEGTEGAQAPFFSPDGRWIGFFKALSDDVGNVEGSLQKVSVSGGLPVKICDTNVLFPSASWGPEDTIVFSHHTFGLYSVPASGGVPEPLTNPDATRGEYRHFAPQILPGGREVLFSIASSEGFRMAILSLASKEWRTVLDDAESARYVVSGHLVFARSGVLLVVPFDLHEGETEGPPVPLLERVSHLAGLGAAHFAVSENGTLAYPPADAGATKSRLVWVDREGRTTPIVDELATYGWPYISPDGRRVAVTATPDIWIYDLERGTGRRMTTAGYNLVSVWSPDGDRLTFSSARAEPAAFFDLHALTADRATEPELLLAREGRMFPQSSTPDGKALAFMEVTPVGEDIGIFEEGQARDFLAGPFNERSAMFSPDGRWLAYVSDESGEEEVYVTRYPGPGGSRRISVEGGTQAVWSRDGRELFYREGSRLMAVPVESSDPVLQTGSPRVLFEGRYGRGYDVSPDGQRFVMLELPEVASSQIYVVLDWFDALEEAAPTEE